MILASILGIPGNNGICEYMKEVWEESKYCKPLEITRKFANDNSITTARRVKSTEMKPFQRFLHFIVMKILVPRFEISEPAKSDAKAHGLCDWLTMVFEAFNVPLIDIQGQEPKRYDFFEETFLNMCQLKREQGVWWLEIGGIRRRDDEAEEVNNEAPAENMENEEVNEEEDVQHDFDWEVVNEEAEIQGESGSTEKFYDAEDEVQGSADVSEEVPK
ncbi:hypothetical protein Dimus_037618, partial [Dionaea muscipula]